MGYASYLEDIRGRLAEELTEMSRKVAQLEEQSRLGPTPAGLREGLQALVGIRDHCEHLLEDVTSMLDVATSPEFDLAHELTQARQDNTRLGQELQSLRSQLHEYKDQLREQKKRRMDAERELRRLNERLGADKDLFRRAVDGYTSDDAIQRKKPTVGDGDRSPG